MIWKPVLVGLVAALGPCVSGAEEGNVAAPPGVLVDVGTHKMNLRCVVAGSPAVILEAGMGDDSRRWSAVLERAPKRFRTCAYDRAGSGASEPGPGPRTMRQEVFELHALLKAASVSGPYVLVGHSYGGLLARLYTAAYPKDVIGLVLVDATHEDTRLFMQRPGEPAGKLVRIRDGARGRIVPPARETMAPASSAPDEDYWADELQEMHESRKAAPEPLGDRPLVVLAAAKPPPRPPEVSAEVWDELQAEKAAQRADLAKLSRNAKLVRDPTSGHHVHVDNPDLVVRSIGEVVDAARTNARLSR